MKITFYSIQNFEKETLFAANQSGHTVQFIENRLDHQSVKLAVGSEAVCIFVNDLCDEQVIKSLSEIGVKYILLRCAGYNNVDFSAAHQYGLRVANVPEYSPYAVAEHTVALILALNRNIVRAHNRVIDGNFSLNGLTGFDMHGKTVGIVGLGKIGAILARILYGFGCKILAYDLYPSEELAKKYELSYVDIDTVWSQSDIISLHTPLTPQTKYLINSDSIAKMKDGVMLINTSRGGLVNTKDVVNGLKKGKIGYLGLDVYEEEQGLFFYDHSEDILQDDTIARLLTFKNVLITSHQAFLTSNALKNIADTTFENADSFSEGKVENCRNELVKH